MLERKIERAKCKENSKEKESREGKERERENERVSRISNLESRI